MATLKGKQVPITAYIPMEMYQALKAVRREKGIPANHVVRRGIELALAELGVWVKSP